MTNANTADLKTTEFAGFDEFSFEYKDRMRPVLRIGDNNQPAVLIIQELPGMTRHTLDFARRLNADGYCVYLPLLFGQPNSAYEPLRNIGRICISREMRLLALGQASPASDWLRALCRHMRAQHQGRRVGAIGMCLSGGFVLSLLVDDAVAAPVLSQPAHARGFVFPKAKASLGIPADTLAAAARRSKDENLEVMAMRFTGDIMCSKARFDHLQELFEDRLIRIEIDSSIGNPHGIPPWAHSVMTVDYSNRPDHPTRQAYEQLTTFLARRLSA